MFDEMFLNRSALVLDDITDNAYTRRDNLCWYKLPTVRLRLLGVAAIVTV